jgi:hypothetical protein
VFLVAIVLAIGKAGAAALIASLFRVAIVALGVYAGWVYLQRAALQDQATELRSLDERSAALMARAIAPGLALSCLDGLASNEPGEVAAGRAGALKNAVKRRTAREKLIDSLKGLLRLSRSRKARRYLARLMEDRGAPVAAPAKESTKRP